MDICPPCLATIWVVTVHAEVMQWLMSRWIQTPDLQKLFAAHLMHTIQQGCLYRTDAGSRIRRTVTRSQSGILCAARSPEITTFHVRPRAKVYGKGDADAVEFTFRMDLSEIAVRHAVAVQEIRVKHSVEVSPVVVSLAREVRYTVIAIVLGVTTLVVARTFWASRRPPRYD